MDITWLGNSTFLIKTSLGKRILIDPINKFHSCSIENLSPNVITLSNYSNISTCVSNLNPDITLITDTGIHKLDIGEITGYTSFCDKFNGDKRGVNIIYLFDIDGFKICHLGYLGELLTDDLIEKFKYVDILFIPIGGNININGREAFKLTELINPKIIIPMNYKIDSSSFLFEDIQEFLLESKNVYKITTDSLTLYKDSMDFDRKVILLPYKDLNLS